MIQAIKNLLGLGPKINYAELYKSGAVILDVRTKGEYSGGNIKGSMNIPVDALSGQLHKFKDKSKPIITCCASGMRSAAAKRILISKGFSEVHNGGSWHGLQNKLVK